MQAQEKLPDAKRTVVPSRKQSVTARLATGIWRPLTVLASGNFS